MDQEIYKALLAWGEARKATKDNASVLIASNFSEHVMKQCAERMKAFGEAEHALFRLEDRKDLPKALVQFFKAHHDRGCTVCLLSSSPPAHEECARSIDIYFRAIEELESYVSKSLM